MQPQRGVWTRGRGRGRGGGGGGVPNLNSSSPSQPPNRTAQPQPQTSTGTRPRGSGLGPPGQRSSTRGRAWGAGRGGSGSRTTRDMELMPSVSRSGGLERDGNALKEFKTQEEYRVFIRGKIDAFFADHRPGGRPSETEVQVNQRKERQENILILFRKLREGISSSGRSDAFATEVYETSLLLAAIFDSPVQTTSILSHFGSDLCSIPTFPNPRPTSTSSPNPNTRLVVALISLLHRLVTAYPSQREYLAQLTAISPNVLDRSSDAYRWITALARSLRTFNFVQTHGLSEPSQFAHFAASLPSEAQRNGAPETKAKASPGPNLDLPRESLLLLVHRLRLRARDTAWLVVRGAYRELSLSAPQTHAWLARALVLSAVSEAAEDVTPEAWVERESGRGSVKRKEGDGMDGRWVVVKAR